MLTCTLRRLESLLDNAGSIVAQHLAADARNARADREKLQDEIAALRKQKTDGGDGASSAALDGKRNDLWKLDAEITALCRMEMARRAIHAADASKETRKTCETMVQAWEALDSADESLRSMGVQGANRAYHSKNKTTHTNTYNAKIKELNGVVSAAQVESCRQEFATTVKPLGIPAMINFLWPPSNR